MGIKTVKPVAGLLKFNKYICRVRCLRVLRLGIYRLGIYGL